MLKLGKDAPKPRITTTVVGSTFDLGNKFAKSKAQAREKGEAFVFGEVSNMALRGIKRRYKEAHAEWARVIAKANPDHPSIQSISDVSPFLAEIGTNYTTTPCRKQENLLEEGFKLWRLRWCQCKVIKRI